MSQTDGANRLRWGLTIVLGVVVVVGTGLLLQRPTAPPLEIVSPTPLVPELKVYISGAVARPGVYTFAEGQRVEDALLMAGGPSADADLDRLNLSVRLQDQMHVRVPMRTETQVPDGEAGSQQVEQLININTADADQLMSLYGVGPVTAKRIIDHREQNGPFQRIEELVEYKIMYSSTFERIKDKITAP